MNMKLFLELVARSSGFRSELNNSGRAVTRFTQGAKREFQELRRMAGTVQGKLAGIGLSIGAVKIVMDSARLDKSLTQIGQTAGASAAEVAGLRNDLFRMGRDSGQNIENLKGGFDALIQSGLNMKESKSTLDGINIAMAVTGSNAETLAGGLTVAAQAFQFDLAKPGQALELLDKMVVAGRLGNAELENLSSIFARVGVNAKEAGMDFDKTLAFVEGLSKIERNPERLATLADSTLRVFNNLRYQGSAEKATGVQFFDQSGKRRDALDVVDDLRKKYQQLTTDKQRALFIQAAFGKADLDTIKGIRTLMSGDILPQVKQFFDTIQKAGGTLKHDFSEATRNLVDQAGMLKNDLREAADGFVKPINEVLGQFIQFMRDKKENGGLGLDGKDMVLGGSALTIGTILTARYGSKGLAGMAQKLLKGGTSTAIGVAEGKVLQAAAGVSPVFVVNWPATFGGMDLPQTGPSSKKTAGGARVLKLLPWGSLAGYGLAGATVAGVPISMAISDAARENGWSSPTVGHNSKEYEVMGIGSRGPAKNEIFIDISIDGHGREFIKVNGMNNKVITSANK